MPKCKQTHFAVLQADSFETPFQDREHDAHFGGSASRTSHVCGNVLLKRISKGRIAHRQRESKLEVPCQMQH